jgi:2-polyprenyl-6-methoxyphenol hydroxylase-like FAD-dependent oxidoreductase
MERVRTALIVGGGIAGPAAALALAKERRLSTGAGSSLSTRLATVWRRASRMELR